MAKKNKFNKDELQILNSVLLGKPNVCNKRKSKQILKEEFLIKLDKSMDIKNSNDETKSSSMVNI